MVLVGAVVVAVVRVVAEVVAVVAEVVAVVAGPAAAVEAEELDEDPLPAVVDGVELTTATLAVDDPGISLDTTSPSTAAAPAAATATSLEMRRTLVVASSRRSAALTRMWRSCGSVRAAPRSRGCGVRMAP